MKRLVSIVIVTWNKRADVLNLLDSLHAIRCNCANIVVVDNASTDGSAESIRRHPLAVTLIENAENLGGTGGFNTGIRYALQHLEQEYLWLLDNDAEVTASTLDKMVAVLEGDRSIGVAGSCIMSPEDHGLIVEAGGFVDADSATWRPNRRYQRYESLPKGAAVEDVDYVPACSAVVRAELFGKLGILDERFFLHWDDIDFCARVREAGYRVAAVLDSQVFHGAEKGHSRMTLYYDFRNALLYFGKHASGLALLRAVKALLARNLVSCLYYLFTGRRTVAAYLYQGLADFRRGKFGRAATAAGTLAVASGEQQVPVDSLAGVKKVLVFAVGSYEEVAGAVRALKEFCREAAVHVAVAADRAEAYRLPEVDGLVVYDLFRDGLFAKAKTAAAIFAGGYDLGVTAGNAFTVPYAFVLKRNVVFEGRTGAFTRSDASLASVWKIPFAMLGGNLLALLFLLPVLLTNKVVNGMSTGSTPASADR
jgi:GT2 family glycosyltransferase